MWETWVRSLGREDPLEKVMATYSSTIAWKIPRTEEHGRLQSTGLQRVGHNWATSLYLLLRQMISNSKSLSGNKSTNNINKFNFYTYREVQSFGKKSSYDVEGNELDLFSSVFLVTDLWSTWKNYKQVKNESL